MPTFHQQITDKQIVVVVEVSKTVNEPKQSYRALLDTGSTVTLVTQRVVQQLQLSPIGTGSITVASGDSVETALYNAWVDLPIVYTPAQRSQSDERSHFFMGNNLLIAGLPYQPEGYDVVLGMDFINMFHMTLYQNTLILSN